MNDKIFYKNKKPVSFVKIKKDKQNFSTKFPKFINGFLFESH